MGKINDLKGRQFGRLLVLRDSGKRKYRRVLWECECQCPDKTIVLVNSCDLVTGGSKSCGCVGREKNRKRCSKRGRESPAWTGGICKDGNGYVLVYRPSHPHPANRDRIFAHRLKIEQRIGRFLRTKETVHHHDGSKDNNKQENLMLFPDKGKHLQWHRQHKNVERIQSAKFPYIGIKTLSR